jgi:hypothetical protein
MALLQAAKAENGRAMSYVAANILNTLSLAADVRWSFSFEFE